MHRLFVPSWGPSDWRRLLANPGSQWVRRKSAYELAVAWEAARGTARGLPDRVAAILDTHDTTKCARLILGLPELQVSLPGGGHASQTDLWALLRADTRLVSMAVESKSGEPFDRPVSAWLSDAKEGSGKPARLEALRAILAVGSLELGHIRYQLLHRCASAILLAREYSACAAVLLIQAFGAERDQDSRADFAQK